jgi:hypothetical protein
MELVLRKRSTGDALRLKGARVLCRQSRKLAFLAPYAGQWVFYSLLAPSSPQLLYNRRLAPPRCLVAVGDLLELDGLELTVDSVEVDPGALAVQTGEPIPCAIEMPGKSRIQVRHDVLIGSDACGEPCVTTPRDRQTLRALLTFAAGRWHLHDLNGDSLVRNGKPAGASLVLTEGDRVRIHDRELRFSLNGTDRTPGKPEADLAEQTAEIEKPAACRDTTELTTPTTPDIDLVYAKAKELCQQLWPLLRASGQKSEGQLACRGGLRGWLSIFRRPKGPEETLERLRFLLSGSPKDRVWLLELARFLFQQSYPGLCLRLLQELRRLYPNDVAAARTLAKFYYQQGRNFRLPAEGRLNAFAHAARCTRLVRRLTPNDPLLGDLERAIREERTILTNSLEEKAARADYSPQRVEAMEGMQ